VLVPSFFSLEIRPGRSKLKPCDYCDQQLQADGVLIGNQLSNNTIDVGRMHLFELALVLNSCNDSELGVGKMAAQAAMLTLKQGTTDLRLARNETALQHAREVWRVKATSCEMHTLSEMTFWGLGIWDLGIVGLGFVYLGHEGAGFRAVESYGLGPAQRHRRTGRAQKERGPGFVGTSIKKSESTVDCARQHTRACAA
jgi:hypothetical protein